MKIPETSANVGAYYGNEENGQWQPNGVIIDSGVPGGVVGSGDGLHPQPVYPVHIPREHIPGYVMAGAYYAGAGYGQPDDFADYMWMENEEEFDKQVMQQLEEEALMEQCIEAMLEDEQRERQRPHNGHTHYPTTSNGNPSLSLEEAVSRSTLNPLAAEFVPTRGHTRPHADEKKVTESKSSEEPPREPSAEAAEPEPHDEDPVKTEEPLPPVDPPEVSAADVTPIDKNLKKDKIKTDPKKAGKVEPRKVKPVAVKSEPSVHKKKEVKAVKSETKIDEREREDAPVIVAEVAKVAPSLPTEAPAGPKPINYAAAARANKPKKPPTTITPTPTPTTQDKPPTIKDKLKEKKPTVQRKNSAKNGDSSLTAD